MVSSKKKPSRPLLLTLPGGNAWYNPEKSKDRNVSYRGYITIKERGVGWVGLEGGGIGLNSTCN